jgi:hypothetical protein
MHDEEIAAVRSVRHLISEECAHDVHRVAAYYRSAGKQLRELGEIQPVIASHDEGSRPDSANTCASSG